MEFTKKLREGVRRGEITCSVRIWQRPHVKAGNRYRMGEGEIEVNSIEAIELSDITPKLARESGFDGVVDLLKTAKHGSGSNVYLVRFHYVARRSGARDSKGVSRAAAAARKRKKLSADGPRTRVQRILARLPEAEALLGPSGQHSHIFVRKRRFGYLLVDHHGDGRIALNCRASEDMRDMLEHVAPSMFHVPKYLGSKGWIGLWLDGKRVDWSAVELALREGYLLTAPKKLVSAFAIAGSKKSSRGH